MSGNEDIGLLRVWVQQNIWTPEKNMGGLTLQTRSIRLVISVKKFVKKGVNDANDYDDVEEPDPENLNTKGNGSGSVQSKKRSRVKGPLDMYVTATPHSRCVEGEERKKRNIWSLR
ncbi:General transcription factor 3C polypeptide 4 [Bienertia sinuspersici]